jgi:hypothetical protein
MSPEAYVLLADCTAMGVYMRSHDRRLALADTLIEAGLATLWGKRLQPTEAGLTKLRDMAR